MIHEISSYTTRGGIEINRLREDVDYDLAVDQLAVKLDTSMGVLLSSSYEYPNRYKRWDIGFVNPPIMMTSRGREILFSALNKRGVLLLKAIESALEKEDSVESLDKKAKTLSVLVQCSKVCRFAEEERSRQPSVFSVLRAIIALFYSTEDKDIGLYGAFGYDLAFQFEEISLKLERDCDQRDLVLFIPDRLLLRDHERKEAYYINYDFTYCGCSTVGLTRTGQKQKYSTTGCVKRKSDHKPGEYCQIVRLAKEAFICGDLFEVVPGQTFFSPCSNKPSEIFHRLKVRNPSPYGLFMNLGRAEYLVGASPEMFVRVNGKQIESCPISGTIARGANALDDADQILALLNSEKDNTELTMCTDVDRNDKSRVCVPGSIKVVGRRQIEMYSRLIHTVDHVTGTLRDEFDALDAFLSHTWAVTVTGAPKHRAMQFIEDHERTPRRWYGGAIGMMAFNGNLTTGLTLRTVRINQGIAEIRVGATLLYDSEPEKEDAETRLKASALIDAITRPEEEKSLETKGVRPVSVSARRKVLLVDHQDSFVHTLADYCRQTSAQVTTWRYGFTEADLRALNPDLVILSPGPGRPVDFALNDTIGYIRNLNLPVFGVCLGLQGIVEYCGGTLELLPKPVHGKTSKIHIVRKKLFASFPETLTVGRYHSLRAAPNSIPPELEVTAYTEDGTIMAIEHQSLPWAAVQFHPESIMSMKENIGIQLLSNVVSTCLIAE